MPLIRNTNTWLSDTLTRPFKVFHSGSRVCKIEIRLFDSRSMIVEEHPWKEEDGKYYYDSGIQGEVLGEPVSPWMEIQETEDGIEWMTYRLVKAEEL